MIESGYVKLDRSGVQLNHRNEILEIAIPDIGENGITYSLMEL